MSGCFSPPPSSLPLLLLASWPLLPPPPPRSAAAVDRLWLISSASTPASAENELPPRDTTLL